MVSLSTRDDVYRDRWLVCPSLDPGNDLVILIALGVRELQALQLHNLLLYLF